MGKRLSLAGAIGVLLAALSVAPAAAAEKDPLASCIQSSIVCVFDGATINASEAVTAEVSGKAKVAVVPYDASTSLNPNQLATQLAQSSGTEELILVIDLESSDRFGVYSQSGRTDEILEALNSAGRVDGGEAIVVSDVGSLYGSPAPSNEASDGIGFLPLAVVLPAVALVALIGGGVAVLKRRAAKGQREVENQPSAATVREQRSVEISEELRGELTQMASTAERYSRPSADILREAAVLISSVNGHIYELFKRIDRKNSKQNREIAQVRYLDTTRKLNSTLSKDYFEDIVKNPGLWDKPSEKIDSVLTALRSVDRQVIENIKQVNSSKDIEFRVAIDSLIGSEAIGVEEAFGATDTAGLKIADPFGDRRD